MLNYSRHTVSRATVRYLAKWPCEVSSPPVAVQSYRDIIGCIPQAAHCVSDSGRFTPRTPFPSLTPLPTHFPWQQTETDSWAQRTPEGDDCLVSPGKESPSCDVSLRTESESLWWASPWFSPTSRGPSATPCCWEIESGENLWVWRGPFSHVSDLARCHFAPQLTDTGPALAARESRGEPTPSGHRGWLRAPHRHPARPPPRWKEGLCRFTHPNQSVSGASWDRCRPSNAPCLSQHHKHVICDITTSRSSTP